MPDLVQPVIGFRRWKAEDGLLRSLGAGEAIWDPDITVAECEGRDKMGLAGQFVMWSDEPEPEPEPTPHDAPAKDCGCGLYAYHSLSKRDTSLFMSSESEPIQGAIAAWGRIEVHETGFRAEKARIIALGLDDACVESKRRKLIHELAATYGAIVVPFFLLAEEARQHGIVIPKEMRPERPMREMDWSRSLHDMMQHQRQLQQMRSYRSYHAAHSSFTASYRSDLWTPEKGTGRTFWDALKRLGRVF